MPIGTLVLGDQLFPLRGQLRPEDPVFMREDMGLACRFRYHQQKLVLFFSAMRHYAEELRKAGFTVEYQALGDGPASFPEALQLWVDQHSLTTLNAYEPADRFFLDELKAVDIEILIIENPGFITNGDDWQTFRERKRLLMADFYRLQRVNTDLLMTEEGQPVGGRWSFDTENRSPIPQGLATPHLPSHDHDRVTQQVIEMVHERFPEHPGDAREFDYAVDRAGATACLDRFIEERFAAFGRYEDAMRAHETVLWHSVLTPFLNTGLLTPRDVLDRAVMAYDKGVVPLASAEGFIRQILGWREFMRGIDREYGLRGFGTGNWPQTFAGNRTLAPSWYDGSTGLFPLDTVIQRTLRHGYCHHIERLMVLGSAMLMADIEPEEAYRWFMEMFVDSADWVMAPNVMGMSLFADGGLFATKPYFSGSAYLRKMGDWPKGDWTDVWDGLYWRFIDRNRKFFERNPRTATLCSGVDRLEPIRRERIFVAAEGFINEHTRPSNKG